MKGYSNFGAKEDTVLFIFVNEFEVFLFCLNPISDCKINFFIYRNSKMILFWFGQKESLHYGL